jgi:hypothetical protein
MKKFISLSTIAFILVACGTTKNTSSLAAEPIVPVNPTVTSGTKITATKLVRDMTIFIPKEGEVPREVKQVPPPNMGEPITETKENIAPETKKLNEAFDHAGFNELLNNNVTPDGKVNYIYFKQDRTVLRIYISALSKKMPTDAWSKEDKLAYWMNAYNAMTIDLILRNQPIASIKDIKDPWMQRLWKLGDKWYNLDEIEHQILRKMNDPRIHFGINCASFSCPPLLNEAFTAQNVDTQLDALAKQFVNDTQRNTITPERVRISKIFNWFSKDFKQDGSLVDFLNKYTNTPINSKAKVRYMDYNWELNN